MSQEFAYVSFVNNNTKYIELMKITIASVLKFSQFKFIIYCIDIPYKAFEDNERIEIRNIYIKLDNIYYYKPYVILDSIKKGLKEGYYIESDDVLTPFADNLLTKYVKDLDNIPISPIHPDDYEIPLSNMVICNSMVKTQNCIHGHVLFNEKCENFIIEWLENCTKYNSYINADETVLNLMYWKYNCKNHYLPIIDPWYENFYNKDNNELIVCTYHGCKDPNIQRKLLDDMIHRYD